MATKATGLLQASPVIRASLGLPGERRKTTKNNNEKVPDLSPKSTNIMDFLGLFEVVLLKWKW